MPLLHFYQDYSVNDIAAILQCPEGTVKTQIRRGLLALRQQSNEGARNGSRKN